MKLALRELEEARRDPARFAARIGRQGGVGMSRLRALQLAAYSFHRQGEDVDVALQYLADLYDRNFKRKEYLPKLEEQLQDYVAAYRRRGAVMYQVQGRVSITVSSEPELVLTGEVGRVDLGGGRYSAWMLGMKPFAWTGELRMPLLQTAIAQRHGVGSELVSVGWYFFETSDYEAETFSGPQIAGARREVEALGAALAAAGPLP